MRKVERLLVTGGAGFMGSSFVQFALEKGVQRLVNLDLLTYAASLDVAEREHPSYRFIHGDICDSELVEEIVREEAIDTLVHFAAETHVDRSIHDPSPFLKANVVGTFQLLEVVRRHPHLHFHHVSTDEVYGSIEEGWVTEGAAYQPTSPYAASKAASDHFVRAFHRTFGIKVTLSHSSNNYGPRQYPEKLIPLVLTRALAGRKIPLYGSGEQSRDWLFVDDHSRAVWEIITRGVSGGVYNVCSGAEVKNCELIAQLLSALAEEVGRSPEPFLELVEQVADRPGHDVRYAMDSSKIRRELGWAPRVSLEEGLKAAVKWYFNRTRGHTSPLCSTEKK